MKRPHLHILVTAIGGDLGQGIVKALRLCEQYEITISGSDVSVSSIGAAFVQDYHQVPPSKNLSEYLERVNEICQTNGIQVIVPASEPEIEVLSHLETFPHLPCGTKILCQSGYFQDIYGDKLYCMQALAKNISLALFADGQNQEEVEKLLTDSAFPFVVKSRRSSGSRTLRVANNRNELNNYLKEISAPLVQAYIEDSYGEFSIGLFAGEQFKTAIAFKRKLGIVGASWYAETHMDADVLAYTYLIADALELKGAINVQVRKNEKGVFLLEINPRFSSLVAARAFCGFHDVEWSLRQALGDNAFSAEPPYRSIRFQRFFHEMIDVGNGFHGIEKWTPQLMNDGNGKRNRDGLQNTKS